MREDNRKTIMLKLETYELLKQIDSSPGKAIKILLENYSGKKNSDAGAQSSILLELNQLQDLIEQIVKLNGLRTN